MSEEVQVSLRDKWEHEALDFTPWLADNLEQLGQAIGLKLEPVGQEHQVGSFSLDILAKTRESDDEVLVAIENQLERTDHGHLGQLILYAAGTGAGIAIWVADEFQFEHAEALDKLNKWTSKTVKFYGVKVDLLRGNGDSKEPRFHMVVSPYHWDRTLTLPTPPPPNPEIEKHQRFFDPLISSVPESVFTKSPSRAFGYNDRFFPSAFKGEIGYVVSLEWRKRAWVYFLIRAWDSVDTSNKLFEMLREEQEQIKSSVGARGEWHWDKYEKNFFATIGVSVDGSIDDPPDQLEETRKWMLELLPKFKAAFEERTARLLDVMRGMNEDTR